MSTINETTNDPEFDLPEDLDESQFDDPEDFVDDISDEDLLPDLLKERPQLDLNTDTIIVVDNAPKVKPDRLAKLENVLTRVFSKFGNVLNQFHPMDENELSKGYFFMEFANREQTEQAVKAGNGYKLDKSHVFIVNHFSDFDKYRNLPEEWEPPTKEEYKEMGNLKSWLLDQDCNDQFAVIHAGGTKTAVAFNTPKGPKPEIERMDWTDTYVRWSPKGTYLATFHRSKGIALWGCSTFKRVQRIYHPGAEMLDFSPCERYVVTYCPGSSAENVLVTDCRTGTKKRGFSVTQKEEWPILKWSSDGKYFARKGKDLLSVYETPSFGLLGKESFVVKGIADFQWSPDSNIIAYWVPEQGSIPAKVALLDIPNRNEIRSKNLFQVSECRLQWHKQGDFLCVRVNRWATKSKKNLTYNLEVFHMREQDIPVDTIEIKEPVIAYQLEPHGNRLAIIHGISPRIRLSLYNISKSKGSIAELITIMGTKQVSDIFWSPRGQFFVLAALKRCVALLLTMVVTHAWMQMWIWYLFSLDMWLVHTHTYIRKSICTYVRSLYMYIRMYVHVCSVLLRYVSQSVMHCM
jgi:translation initiation factor 3 subunit B